MLRNYRLEAGGAGCRGWPKAAVLTTRVTKTDELELGRSTAAGLQERDCVQSAADDRHNKAQVTLCVEIGSAGQAAAPCDLVARKLWHSERRLLHTELRRSNHAHTLKPIQRRPELAA